MNMKFLIGFLILVLATCSLYNPTPRGSGIEGQVFIGPEGPHQATLTVLNPNGVQIAQVRSDAQGHFRLPLVPGEYILHPESLDGVAFASDQVFVVETSRYTQLNVNYERGSR